MLLAQWIGTGNPAPRTYELQEGTHRYRLAIQPSERIELGRRVRILALTPIAYHMEDAPGSQYDTYEPHIVGVVSGMTLECRVSTEGSGDSASSVVVMKIDNECRGSMVSGVDLEFSLDHGAAARPERPGKRPRRGRRDADGGPRRSEGHSILLSCVRPRPECKDRACSGATCWLGRPERLLINLG